MGLELGQNCSLMLRWHFSLQVDFDKVRKHGRQLAYQQLVSPLFLS